MSAVGNKKLMQEIFAGVACGERAAYVDRLADDVTMTVTGQVFVVADLSRQGERDARSLWICCLASSGAASHRSAPRPCR